MGSACARSSLPLGSARFCLSDPLKASGTEKKDERRETKDEENKKSPGRTPGAFLRCGSEERFLFGRGGTPPDLANGVLREFGDGRDPAACVGEQPVAAALQPTEKAAEARLVHLKAEGLVLAVPQGAE